MLTAIIGLILVLLFLIAAAEILTAKASLMFKLGWLLVILLLPGVGLLLYYFIGRGMRGA
jgi:hypothetical protein